MKSETFKSFTAMMIALCTVVSALVTWRAAIASNDAKQADFDGLAATINGQEAMVINNIDASEHYQAFLKYVRYDEMYKKVLDDLDAKRSTDDQLDVQESNASGLAYSLQELFFPTRYLRTDGTYDLQRELDEKEADAARTRDVRDYVHFSKADSLRFKANVMISLLFVMGVAFWLFTLAQIIENRIKYLFAAGGMLFLVLGMVAAMVVEYVEFAV